MIQNKKQFFKNVVEVLVSILGLISAILFFKAVFSGHNNDSAEHYTHIHIFVNQNDSIVNQLQKDVDYLISLIEKAQADTVVVETRRPKVVE